MLYSGKCFKVSCILVSLCFFSRSLLFNRKQAVSEYVSLCHVQRCSGMISSSHWPIRAVMELLWFTSQQHWHNSVQSDCLIASTLLGSFNNFSYFLYLFLYQSSYIMYFCGQTNLHDCNIGTTYQGCGLGQDVSVSRRSNVSVSDKILNVSVSEQYVSVSGQ